MGRIRAAVAALLVASVVAAGLITSRSGSAPTRRIVTAGTTTTAAADGPPTTTEAPHIAGGDVPTTLGPPPAVVAPAATVPPAPSDEAKVIVSPTGVTLTVIGRDAAGWRVLTPCGATRVVATGTPVTSAAVVLDAGHGGGEAGAVGPNGLTEKVLNLAVVGQAKAALERQGLTVVLTRAADYRMTLSARALVATALRPRAFVSVHHNAEPDGPFDRPGTETYYQVASGDSKRLSGLIYEEVVRALAAYPVPWVADRDAGAKYRRGSSGDDYYAVLRQTHGVVAALAELAFISDPNEAALLTRPDVQAAEGAAVARGIVRYLTSRDPGSGYVTPYDRTEPAGGGGGPEGCTDPPL